MSNSNNHTKKIVYQQSILNKHQDDSPFYHALSIFVLIAVFIYTVIRAIHLSITHDEALTFLIHAQGSLKEIFKYTLRIPSNNHLLHTLLLKLCLVFFGISEPIIRIPALLGHALYLTGIYLILKLYVRKGVFITGTLLLVTNPYMLDFFSCARGYAPGLGFCILGLFYFIKHFRDAQKVPKARDVLLGSLLLAFSALSNLSFLNVFITLTVLTLLSDMWIMFVQKKDGYSPGTPIKTFFYRSMLPLFPSILLLASLYTGPILLLRRLNELYYGGRDGLWLNTIPSMIESSLYDKTYGGFNFVTWGRWLIAILVLSACALIVRKIIRRQPFVQINYFLTYHIVLLILLALCIIMQNLLFKTLFVIHRTALYFIPLFYLFLIVFWENIRYESKPFVRHGVDIIFSTIIILTTFHFLNCANISYFVNWEYDACTKQMMRDLKAEIGQKELHRDSISLVNTWLFEPSINYYRVRYHMTFLKQATRNSLTQGHDYYYLYDKDRELVEKYCLKVIVTYPLSKTLLARPDFNTRIKS